MQSNFGNISMDDALRMAQTPAGQQLLNLISQVNSQDLQNAMDLASAGDLSGAQKVEVGERAAINLRLMKVVNVEPPVVEPEPEPEPE